MTFAVKTSVPVAKTRIEIEKLLVAHKAYQHGTMMDDVAGVAYVAFTMGTGSQLRQVKITLPLPKRESFARQHRRGRGMVLVSDVRRDKAFEQACRSKWRMLLLVLKANLEAIEAGVTTFEKAFFAFIRLPGGETLHDAVAPKLAHAYETGMVPPLLGTGS